MPTRGLPLRAVAPNAVTALALCSGLTGIRFAISGQWETAVLMVMIASVLDGIDGRIARMVRGESRFGAELDSLSDAISFGVSPALILYLWSLKEVPRFGWLVALVFAVFCALRLARFKRWDRRGRAAAQIGGLPYRRAGSGGRRACDATTLSVVLDRSGGVAIPHDRRTMGCFDGDADGVERCDL